SFFFFQAEDGIRDFHVTGVQTCALPIFTVYAAMAPLRSISPLSRPAASTGSGNLALRNGILPQAFCSSKRLAVKSPTLPAILTRSEERRVGKECRYRGCT